MIIPVRKYLIIGAKEDLDHFFDRAQHQGFLEFITTSAKRPVEHSQEVQNLIAALKELRKLPLKAPYTGNDDRQHAFDTAQRILSLKADIEKLHEERRLLQTEIARVAPFGDFSRQDIDFIEQEGKVKIQFWCMKTEKSHKTAFPDEIIYVATDYDLDYFISINPEPKHYPHMIEMRIDRPVGELQNQLSFVKDSLHQMEAELKGYAGHIEFLHEALVEELNEYNLAWAKKESTFPLQNSLFIIEAWVPENKVKSMFAFIDGMTVHCEEIVIEPEDRVPTFMENHGVNRIGEDLVLIYDCPATNDKDPSPWVLWAFTVFFAIIVSDAGYGLIYLSIALYLKYKFPKMKGAAKRFCNLFVIMSCGCILWGVATSSYFGLKLNPHNPLAKISILRILSEKKADYHLAHNDEVHQSWIKKHPPLAKASTGEQLVEGAVVKKEGGTITYEMLDEYSRNFLLEFSLIIGIIHISISFLRYLRRNWAGIGWIAYMVGGYLFFPFILNATTLVNIMGWVDKDTAKQVGQQLVYGGIGAAVFLSLLQNRWKGFGEVTNIIKVSLDVLSYLRLYALGLAATIMAETFNGIGVYIGLVAGFVAMIIGHLINIQLGMMAGVIHGLRLNFLEWYHYCFEGNGRLFKPLKRLKP